MRRFCILIIATLLLSNTGFAGNLHELYVGTEDNKTSIESSLTGGQFGAALTSGDYNNDGYNDLAVGAPFASLGPNNWLGAITIIFGNSSSEIKNKLIFFGTDIGDQYGTTLETGDFNNDSIDDLVIGSYNAYSDAGRPSKVDIIYGRSTLSSQGVKYVDYKPDIGLTGVASGDAFGMALSTVDINNDGTDDLLIGAPFAENRGKVYGFFGGSSGIGNIADITFSGKTYGERFGSAIAAGDINDDEKDDVIVSAYYADTESYKQAGAVYIYEKINSLEGNVGSTEKFFKGDTDHGWFGFDISVGDVNGDGIDDLAATTFPYSGDRMGGKAEIFFGARIFDDNPDLEINDPVEGLSLGARVNLKDLNNDGKDDVILGSPGIGDGKNYEEGDVYILNGASSFKNSYSIRRGEITSAIHGENTDDWFGYSLGTTDFNNDGDSDLIVGSRYSDIENGVNNGKVFILYGDNSIYGQERVATVNEKTISRAELVGIILDKLDLRIKKSETINQCYEHIEFCLFNFMAMSSYDDIQLEPAVILYPDIQPDSQYYDDVTTATMLGIINGYINDADSPFRPQNPISRIQALKILLGAADLVPPKYKFELADVLGSLDALQSQPSYFDDVDPRISHMWWYPRYVNFAVDQGIVDTGGLFRPDDPITMDELDEMIARTLNYLSTTNEEVNP